jgi:hypothetical protein
MNKRLTKRHKREVARAKQKATVSQPDVRTPEEIRAAKEASRPVGGWGNSAGARFSKSSARDHAGPSAHSAAKTDA